MESDKVEAPTPDAPLPAIEPAQAVEVIIGFIRSQMRQAGFQRLVVGLSGGTTTTAIAAALAARDDLAAGPGITVVTNAVNIAAQLATRPDIKVVVTGGVIHSRSYELVGPFVEQLLRGVRLDIAFIGVNGMDAAAGATTQDEREAAVNRMMAERARRAVVVTDSSKIGTVAFAAVGGPELFPVLLTDDGSDDAALAAFRDAGYEVMTA